MAFIASVGLVVAVQVGLMLAGKPGTDLVPHARVRCQQTRVLRSPSVIRGTLSQYVTCSRRKHDTHHVQGVGCTEDTFLGRRSAIMLEAPSCMIAICSAADTFLGV